MVILVEQVVCRHLLLVLFTYAGNDVSGRDQRFPILG